MDYSEFVRDIANRYDTAASACKAVSGRSFVSWSETDPNTPWSFEYRASLYRALDEQGQTYYTFVGADPLSYRRIEIARIQDHKFIVHLDQFHQDFLDILDCMS
jgi:hypothetical protein